MNGNSTKQRIRAIWIEILGYDDFDDDDNFYALGGDSIKMAEMYVLMESKFKQTLSLMEFTSLNTVHEMADYIDNQQMVETVLESIVSIKDMDSIDKLFFVHDIFGDVSSYYLLARHVDLPIGCYGVKLPDSIMDQSDIQTLQDLAKRYVKDLMTFETHTRFHFIGLSVGGVIAHEIACELQKQGREVASVMLLDSTFSTEKKARRKDIGIYKTLRQAFISLDGLSFVGIVDKFVDKFWSFSKRFTSLIIAKIKISTIKDTDDVKLPRFLHRQKFIRKISHNKRLSFFEGTLYFFLALKVRKDLPKNWLALAKRVEVIKQNCYHTGFVKEGHVEETSRNIKKVILGT